MTKKMLIDATHAEETRVAVVDGHRLVDYDYESKVRKQLKGSIFLAKITRVEPSLQAAFVNFGGNRHGFLPFSEIHPDYFRIPIADREALLAEQEREMEARRAEEEAEEDEEEERATGLSGEDADEEDEDDEDIEEIGGDHALPSLADDDSESGAVASVIADGPDAAVGGAGPVRDEAAGDAAAAVDASVLVDFGAADDAAFAQEPGGDAEAESERDDAEAEGAGEDGEGRRGRGRGDRRFRGRGRGRGRGGRDRMAAQSRRVEMVGGDGIDGDHPVRPTMRRHYKIQEVIKRGQIMLIQVSKEERGNKGAAVTTYLSLPGRYCVLMPNSPRAGGVSRKIASVNERKRMREILSDLQVGDGMSVIMRTAGMSRNKAEIKRDLDYLTRLWDNIRELTLQSTAPALIHEEGNLIRRAIRDIYGRDVDDIEVAGEEGYKTARDFMKMMIPSHVKRVNEYKDERIPLFHRYQVENQIFNMGEPSVTLKSGGYLVINPTEALVSIDVNSGRATKERHIEETALKTNLEAADEVARQLRLRDLGGLVVIDFIDMEDRRNNRRVEQRLKEALSNDRARIQIGRISSFGLLELSRQRLNPSLTEAQFEKCPHCKGVGNVRTTDSAAIIALRAIEDEGIRSRSSQVMLSLPSDVAIYMLNHKRAMLADLERRYDFSIVVRVDESLAPAGFKVESLRGLRHDDEEDDEETPDSAARAAEDGQGRGRRNRNGRGGRGRDGGRGERDDRRHEQNDRPDEHDRAARDDGDDSDFDADEAREQDAEGHDGSSRNGGGDDRERRGRRRGRRGGRRRNRFRNENGENGEGEQRDGDDAGFEAGEAGAFDEAASADGFRTDTDHAGADRADADRDDDAGGARERRGGRGRRRREERTEQDASPAAETFAPAQAEKAQDTAPSNDTAPPPARDYERVNEAPSQKKKGWWNRLTE